MPVTSKASFLAFARLVRASLQPSMSEQCANQAYVFSMEALKDFFNFVVLEPVMSLRGSGGDEFDPIDQKS